MSASLVNRPMLLNVTREQYLPVKNCIMIEYMYIVKYCIFTFVTILLFGFLIAMIYIIRSIIKIPKGPYTWITNICTFTLFLFMSVCLILGLVYFSPKEGFSKTNSSSTAEINQPDLDSMMKMELSTEFSMFISKYAMYPVVVVEMVIYVSLSTHLLWMWYSNGEFDTIVNKLIFIQRIFGIFDTTGLVVDYVQYTTIWSFIFQLHINRKLLRLLDYLLQVNVLWSNGVLFCQRFHQVSMC